MYNKYLSIKDALILLYDYRAEEYKQFHETEENRDKASLFAKFIELKFKQFIETVSRIEREELSKLLISLDDFRLNKTRIRFINLLTLICSRYLSVLRKCYCSNPVHAIHDLEKLLGANNHQLMKYIVEPLVNYCSYAIDRDAILYRIRDEKEDKDVDNCWHVPFNIRQFCYSGRFSSPGFPCLYLGSNIETCISEAEKIKSGYQRWVGEFSLKKGGILITLDLRLPSGHTIDQMNEYDTFCAFLSYPLRILCGTYAYKKSDSFAEEYLFSQLLVNLLSNSTNEKLGLTTLRGITYDSTKCIGGINYALPAIPSHYPPKEDEKVSDVLKELLIHNKIFKLDS